VTTSALIHISDTQFGANYRGSSVSRSDAGRICDLQLVDDVRQILREKQLSSDRLGLAIGGSVASAGGPEDYSAASKAISRIKEELNIGSDRVAIVPGNLDVDRSSCRDCPEQSEQKGGERTSAPPGKLDGFGRFFGEMTGGKFPGPGRSFSFPGLASIGFGIVGIDTVVPRVYPEDDDCGSLGPDATSEAGMLLRALLKNSPNAIPIALLHHCPFSRGSVSGTSGAYLEDGDQAYQSLFGVGFRWFLCAHARPFGGVANLRAIHTTFPSGPLGVNVDKLHRYHARNRVLPTNRYEIFVLGADGILECILRKLSIPGGIDASWERDTDDGIDRFPVFPEAQSAAGSLRTLGIGLGMSNPVAFGHRSGSAISVALAGDDDALAMVEKVTYSLSSGGSIARSNPEEKFRAELLVGPGLGEYLVVELVLKDGGGSVNRKVHLPAVPARRSGGNGAPAPS
jgi:hypothetical protein